MILLRAAQSRKLDRLSQTRYGIPSYALMTRAGEAVAETVMRRSLEQARAGVLVIAGKGNNGGDGLVAARRLGRQGLQVSAILLASVTDLRGDAARACQDYRANGGMLLEAPNGVPVVKKPGVVIDAIFGTGLQAEVRSLSARAIEVINELGAPVVAVDIPSGINSDSGAVMGVAVKAARTITFGLAKYGHVSYPGAEYTGELEVADIGFAPQAIREIAPKGELIECSEAARIIPLRAANAHKGTYGHVLIIAGARGKSGAAVLASRGAMHSGAGLVTAAIPNCLSAIVAAGQPELMTEPLPDRDGGFDALGTINALRRLVDGKNALVVGPGMGAGEDTFRIVEWLLKEAAREDRPLLIDADGLNAISQHDPGILRKSPGPVVLTPHPGEMARLLKSSTTAVNSNRIGAARALVEMTGANVLLKGARSIIATAQDEIAVNSSGNPGMATAGMGDVLSGILGSLMAQGIKPGDALKLGVFVHGRAADRLAGQRRFGFLASEVAAEVPYVLSELMKVRGASA
jgi:hydroxyethylthiazole kinase-like uncharacterized protein yjeF